MELRYRLRMIAGVMALAAFAGCGRDDLPELAPVEGTVTLDGIPLPGVLVSFYPSDGGRPGTCETDDEGHYNLIYVSGEEGTRLGKNRVEVSMVWPDGEPTPGLEDVVPSQYKGTDSVLSCDVKAEDNVYDIKMETPVGGQ